ncbi:uncharacterized protein LOC108341616 isoform X2 [Vigna angularis]|uniref:uncharacterized protein LOC108341616 isoform X2 n=1 Tax=Phaseolus angularis TaxID=3914 RepID=UPI0022B546DA|nr:uncharacterized protein LOC108341616 isoform X2 [Vigna angularis]
MERLARSARAWRWYWRSFSSFQTLTSRSSRLSTHPKFASSWFSSSDVSMSRVLPEDYSWLPVFFAGVFGSGLVGVAYADNATVDVQERAKKERERIEELIRSRGIRYGSYPSFSVAVKGQKVSVKFQIPHGCDISQLIANLTARLGTKAEAHGGGSDMLLRAWNSPVAWQLTLSHPSEQKHIPGDDMSSKDINTEDTDLCILIFHSLVGSDKAEIEFIKQGELSPEEVDAFISVLQLAGNRLGQKSTLERKPKEETEKVYRKMLRYHGTTLLVMNIKNGTGKTSCARVIANQAGVPLLYVPLEAIMSEFYGKSERLLGKVFSLANNLPNGAIIFLDEIDSFAAARDNEMHEATRRILSVLLRQIDGFEQDKKVVVIAATNRKEDLDPALISRFDSMIAFGLPDQRNRQEIASKYAKHLSKPELEEFARVTEDLSGRDIRDVCQQAERSWASKIIRGQVPKEGEKAKLPALQEYIECAESRREALRSAAANRKLPTSSHPKILY